MCLQLLQQEDRLIGSISAELPSGVRPDRSISEIRVVAKDPFSAKLLLDNGVFATGELQLPIIRFGEGNLVQIIPFLDFATAWNNSRTSRSGSLLSAGLGLQLRLTDRLVARLDAGLPLLQRDASGNNFPTNNLFFSVEYRFF